MGFSNLCSKIYQSKTCMSVIVLIILCSCASVIAGLLLNAESLQPYTGTRSIMVGLEHDQSHRVIRRSHAVNSCIEVFYTNVDSNGMHPAPFEHEKTNRAVYAVPKTADCLILIRHGEVLDELDIRPIMSEIWLSLPSEDEQ